MRLWTLVGALVLALAGGARADVPRSHHEIGWRQAGLASWYGGMFHGRRMANGRTFNKHGHSAAHRFLPFGTVIEVTSRATGRRERLVVEDRGPFVRGRILDLPEGSARRLGIDRAGVSGVDLVVVGHAPGAAGYRHGAGHAVRQSY